MYVESFFELTKDILKEIGEHQNAYSLLITSTFMSLSGLDTTHHVNNNMKDLYGFGLISFDNVVELKKNFMSPLKENADIFKRYTKVDLWNDSRHVIELHMRTNLIFQILFAYFWFHNKGIKKINPSSENLLEIMIENWPHEKNKTEFLFMEEARQYLNEMIGDK